MALRWAIVALAVATAGARFEASTVSAGGVVDVDRESWDEVVGTAPAAVTAHGAG